MRYAIFLGVLGHWNTLHRVSFVLDRRDTNYDLPATSQAALQRRAGSATCHDDQCPDPRLYPTRCDCDAYSWMVALLYGRCRSDTRVAGPSILAFITKGPLCPSMETRLWSRRSVCGTGVGHRGMGAVPGSQYCAPGLPGLYARRDGCRRGRALNAAD